MEIIFGTIFRPVLRSRKSPASRDCARESGINGDWAAGKGYKSAIEVNTGGLYSDLNKIPVDPHGVMIMLMRTNDIGIGEDACRK